MKHPELFKDFDPYAMVNPKTEGDVIALLDEALAELANIDQHLNILFSNCENSNGK